MNTSPQATWNECLTDARNLLDALLAQPDFLSRCERFSSALIATIQRGGNILVCGNGGSHCDAMHFAEELTGRFRGDRVPLGALALGDASHVTCVGNDIGFEHVFERQVRALGRAPDLLIGLSTSGNSRNVILAIEAAKAKGIATFALLGRDGGKIKNVADDCLIVPHQDSGRIQEIHIKVIHTAIDVLERALFPQTGAHT